MERGRKKKDKLKDVQLHISVNSQDKEEAARILEECGTTINSVIEMLLKYIINHKGVPFPIILPKEESNTDSIDSAIIEKEVFEEKEAKKVDVSIEESIDTILQEEMEYDVNFDNLFQEETESASNDGKDDVSVSGTSDSEIQEDDEYEDDIYEDELLEEPGLAELRAFLTSI